MFHRIISEDWTTGIPVVAFVIFATVFLLVTLRALRLGKAQRQHLANLPLDVPNDSSQP